MKHPPLNSKRTPPQAHPLLTLRLRLVRELILLKTIQSKRKKRSLKRIMRERTKKKKVRVQSPQTQQSQPTHLPKHLCNLNPTKALHDTFKI